MRGRAEIERFGVFVINNEWTSLASALADLLEREGDWAVIEVLNVMLEGSPFSVDRIDMAGVRIHNDPFERDHCVFYMGYYDPQPLCNADPVADCHYFRRDGTGGLVTGVPGRMEAVAQPVQLIAQNRFSQTTRAYGDVRQQTGQISCCLVIHDHGID